MISRFIRSIVNRILARMRGPLSKELIALSSRVDALAMLSARSTIDTITAQGVLNTIQDAEFRVFSQFGDDGIIQYLVHAIPVRPPIFIEFGVDNYLESNTRFLLENNNWRGLVIDKGKRNIDAIRARETYWRHDLVARQSFVTRDNINATIREAGFAGEVGVLSIDIDGNDYWVWEALDVIHPVVVIVEYNSVFGDTHPIAVPYEPEFTRSKAHYSYLLWGASLSALNVLAERKGYVLAGCNSAGINAYFVRRDLAGSVRTCSAKSGFVESRFRDSRDIHGNLNVIAGRQRLLAIKDCEVVDVTTQKHMRIADLYQIGS